MTALDHAAVWSYTAALGLSAVVSAMFARLARRARVAAAIGFVTAAAFALAAIGNALEDAGGVPSAATLYVVGVLVGCVGVLGFAAALVAAGFRALGVMALLLVVPFVLLASWLGLLLVPASAAASWWILRAPRRPMPGIA